MKYAEFEELISSDRMRKYLAACENDTRKAMKLYRLNLKLSQEMFTVISCFEVILRNKIDAVMRQYYGNDWLRDLVVSGGRFYNDRNVEKTKKIIVNAYNELICSGNYSHSKLLSTMEFGVWKYLFSSAHYRLTGRVLLQTFPKKPKSSVQIQYDHNFIFHELNFINNIRNRIAHHEPICFGNPIIIDTTYALTHYDHMKTLFRWMDVDAQDLLYGLDRIHKVCKQLSDM